MRVTLLTPALCCGAQVVMHECFRPGDVVRAEVLSLGDSRSFYLTTAKNELGVVYAKSLAGWSHCSSVRACQCVWLPMCARCHACMYQPRLPERFVPTTCLAGLAAPGQPLRVLQCKPVADLRVHVTPPSLHMWLWLLA
jgi:hypothetical protein